MEVPETYQSAGPKRTTVSVTMSPEDARDLAESILHGLKCNGF